jgi:hypothetical protein
MFSNTATVVTASVLNELCLIESRGKVQEMEAGLRKQGQKEFQKQ